MRFPVTASLRVDVCMKIIRALTFFILSVFAYTRVLTVCVCVRAGGRLQVCVNARAGARDSADG